MSKRSASVFVSVDVSQPKRGREFDTQPDPREDEIEEYESEPVFEDIDIEGVLPPSSQPEVYQRGSGEPEEEISPQNKDKPTIELVTLKKSEAQVSRFNTDEYKRTVQIKFNLANYGNKSDSAQTIQTLTTEIDYLYERLVGSIIEEGMKSKDKNGCQKYTEEDFYSVAIKNEVFRNKPFFIKPKKIKHFKECLDEFSDAASRVIQSNEEFLFKTMEFVVYLTKTPVGSGRRVSAKKRAPIDQEDESKRKKSVITIKNTDNSCGYRAIFLGSTRITRGYHKIENFRQSPEYKIWQRITVQGNCSQIHQLNGTIAFINDANNYIHTWFHNRLPQIPCPEDCEYTKRFDINVEFGKDPDDFGDMNLYLNSIDQNLVVMDGGNVKHNIYGAIRENENDETVFIEWLSKRHFNYISNIVGYVGTPYFCLACYKAHWSTNHICEYVCTVCGEYPKCKEGPAVDCEACNITFVNHKCYSNHLMNTNRNSGPRCFNRKRCENCNCHYKDIKNNKHVCGQYTCKNCNEKYTETPHFCTMKPLDISKLSEEDSKNKIIVTFDIESSIEKEAGEDLHVPNLLISETVCDNCWNKEFRRKIDPDCETCGEGKHVFVTKTCIRQFTDYIYTDLARKAEALKLRIIVFAHNSKGYDGHFIMQDIFKRNFTDQPQIILQGLKVLKMGVNNVDFIDSLSFFQQPLSALPKSFGFEQEVVKGFFPHKFNVRGNWSYQGPMPDLEEFGLNFMSDKAAQECTQWHEEYRNSGQNWNFLQELAKYCENDVKILTMAVMEFRELFKSVTGLDPITRNFTLASVAMEHFRSSVLEKDQLGITPIQGYIPMRNKSMKANIWLDWHQSNLNEEICREVKIGPYYVDGIHKESRTIYEFFGCYYHGCDICFANDRSTEHPFYKPKTYGQIFQESKEKIEYFEQKGYNLIKIWEHDYNQECSSNTSLSNYYLKRFPYYQRINKYGHINIRDAFFGGRTNNIYFSYVCKENEVIKYLDVTSLYPSVLVKNPYPIGHPKVITEFDDTDISEFFGFVKCKVSPPEDLNIPVLPFRDSNKKLLFPLCGKCADEKPDNCNHSSKDRQIVGTWFSEELKLALSKGYTITRLYEVLHYERSSSDLFKKYIEKWLKIKTESSGWPASCDNEEKKQEFIENFEQREGVRLEAEKIEKNPGRRFISKLMLNSFWGKLGQRRNQGQTTICTNYGQFYKLISDAKYEIKGMIRIDDENFLVNYEFSEDTYDRAGNTNIAIAAMVTGYARIKLYSIIDLIESSKPGRTLYFDTDSVIFVDKPGSGWAVPEIGDFLGDMTDEVAKDYGPNAYIDKFTSGGPKNYAYSVKVGESHKYVTKIKGMNIGHGLKDILNFECVRKHAEKYRSGDREPSTVVDQLQFRSSKLHQVYTRIFPKTYRAVSDKRIVLPEGDKHTVPFGFKFN